MLSRWRWRPLSVFAHLPPLLPPLLLPPLLPLLLLLLVAAIVPVACAQYDDSAPANVTDALPLPTAPAPSVGVKWNLSVPLPLPSPLNAAANENWIDVPPTVAPAAGGPDVAVLRLAKPNVTATAAITATATLSSVGAAIADQSTPSLNQIINSNLGNLPPVAPTPAFPPPASAAAPPPPPAAAAAAGASPAAAGSSNGNAEAVSMKDNATVTNNTDNNNNNNSNNSSSNNNNSSNVSPGVAASDGNSSMMASSNQSQPSSSETITATTTTITTTHQPDTTPSVNETVTQEPVDVLPEAGAAEQEHHSSMSIFLVLAIIAVCILMIHYMTMSKLRFLPDSVAVVFLGALIGLILQILSRSGVANWQREEVFSPTVFFLIILPPIIFESGYNLHKGNFFQNFGTILLFAVIGTSISALVVGGGVYLLGIAEVAYQLSFVESFAFGSLISAVDPVATVAIFNALDVDPVLNMLVFGESILNDAVAIVLTTTALESGSAATADVTPSVAVLHAVGRFCVMFGASAALGTVSALLAALLLKHIDLRNNPSLEFAMMLIFTYAPYGLAEGVHLSGIMAILFCGVVMSHYTHYNLSPVTQITMQHTMRTVAFVAETCVFAYLGLAIFSFRHSVQMALVVWSLILCLLGRALNIFPLSALANYFRQHKITAKMQCIMWFSGLRGVIAYALCLHLEFETEKRHVLVTTTLIVVLSTILVLGGATQPLLKYLQADRRDTRCRRRRRRPDHGHALNMSKTLELGTALDSEYLSELTEDEQRDCRSHSGRLSGFARLDYKYFIPFFRRRLTQQELREAKTQMTDLTNKVYQSIRVEPVGDDNDDADDGGEDGNENIELDLQRLIT